MHRMAATLDDLLKVMTAMRGEMTAMRGEMTAMRGEMATRGEIGKFRAEMQGQIAKVREEVDARFDALEEKGELIRGILERTRRDVMGGLRDDVDAIHKGLMKTKPHEVPKDLPSQVRAKGDRPSKPAKKRKRQ
ncbi:MAG: hypothetical protein KIT84_03680 [Labilithrix sp.]|nr:hypothetical protein [Labilithrix sp.]MCW5810084.1 hypothetical protein [Labilithrix sp.]